MTSLPAGLNLIPLAPRNLVPALAVSGQAGTPLHLQFAGSVEPSPTWTPLESLDPSNQWYFDLSASLTAQRFYRAQQSDASGVVPALKLYFAPAIVLTGAIGSYVRLNYINRFGPTNAWFSLGTVTLTNTSQLYFDNSSIGQPPRLYRQVPSP